MGWESYPTVEFKDVYYFGEVYNDDAEVVLEPWSDFRSPELFLISSFFQLIIISSIEGAHVS